MSTAFADDVIWDAVIDGVDATYVRTDAPTRQAELLPIVIFEGDDTVWETEHLYDQARDAAAEIVAAAGLSAEQWRADQLARDMANVERFGLAAERFPTSCLEAYEELEIRSGVAVDPGVAVRVWELAADLAKCLDGASDGDRVVCDALSGQAARGTACRGSKEL